MGQYKVPQNVEAEDKILGPLSMKQFIYALIGLGYGALTFAIFKFFIPLWVIIGLPPALFLLGLGLYQKEDQPLETYVIAIIQFFVRPKRRLWQKEPIAEVFHLEPPPPKKEEVVKDPREVRSQLQDLANLVDTRGWAGKQPELQDPDQLPVIDLRGRIGTAALEAPPVFGPVHDITEADDMLGASSVKAQNLNALMENTVQSIRNEAVENMQRRAPAMASPSVQGGNLRIAQYAQSISGSTNSPPAAIVKIAAEGGDLTVAQVAEQARRYYAKALNEERSGDVQHAEPTAV